jgi:hypothetical protein
MTDGSFEIGGRHLRLLRRLWIATFAVVVALIALVLLYDDSIVGSNALQLTLGVTFGLLTAGLVVAPAIAFILYTRRPDASVTPRIRRSAVIAAAVPLIIGVWGVTANETLLVAIGGVLIALAGAVIVRLTMTPAAESNANPMALRSGMAVLGLVIVMLSAMSRPHGHSPSRTAMTAMRSDLRNLVTAQEVFFDSTKRYDTSVSVLQFTPSTNVNAPRITLGDSGWLAANTHSKYPGITCAIAVRMTNPLVATAYEGEPACTDTVKKRR